MNRNKQVYLEPVMEALVFSGSGRICFESSDEVNTQGSGSDFTWGN